MGVHGRLECGKCVKACRVHVGLVAPTACHLVNGGPSKPRPLRPVHGHPEQNAFVSDALAASVANHMQQIMRASGTHDETSRALLRLAANYRLEVLRPRMATAFGLSVVDGLFAGMRLLPHASEGCFIPKLLGCYEAPLQPSLRSMVDVGYDVVLNVGCAEGYYAVGLARLLPAAEIFAYDIDPAARALCGELAALNGVADRVVIAGAPGPDTFARHAGRRVLLVCDIEGGEVGLLDPAAQPSLLEFDLVVEAHNSQGPVSAVLIPVSPQRTASPS